MKTFSPMQSPDIGWNKQRKQSAHFLSRPSRNHCKMRTVGELIDDALEFVANHKDNRNYKSKAAIVREDMGARHAAEVTPQELERWLREHFNTEATANAIRRLSRSATGKESATARWRSIQPGSFAKERKAGAGCVFSAVRNTTACTQ